MGDIVQFSASLLNNHELIADLCRFAEGIFSESEVKKRHRLPDSVWKQMADDDLLVEKIEAEKVRRIRDGSAKRELAQKHIVRAGGRKNIARPVAEANCRGGHSPSIPHREAARLAYQLSARTHRQPTHTIYRHGPNAVRNRKSAITQTKILAENGWLAPIKSRRRDSKEWRIARGPGE